MDLSNQYQHVHCVGIGGIGLSAIAEIFLERGAAVSGSDTKPGAVTARLEEHGAKIFYEHKAENIQGADCLIYSNAVAMDNPELLAARERGIPCFTRAEALGALMEQWPCSIAVAGTHGKTTTTSMISLILKNSNTDPTILVGGILSELGGNVLLGRGDYFITEACEYMDSFLQLAPTIAIILNIDSDHLDYFKDIEHIVNSFARFAMLLPEDGTLIAYKTNPFVASIIKELPRRVLTFGPDESADYYCADIAFNTQGMPSFDVCHAGEKLCRLQLAVPGEHNIANALAAFACCYHLGLPLQTIVETLEQYGGTQRRFDVVGRTKAGVTIVDDYAHHPTEIRATLRAAKNVPHRESWCLFQPHTYTRTRALFNEFAEAFADADHLILTEIYAAREKNIYKISASSLAEEIRMRHPEKDVSFIEDFGEIASYVRAHAKEGDLVITMGAGDIYKVGELLLAEAEAEA